MKRFLLVGASLNSGNKGVNALTRGQINLIVKQYGIENDISILSYTVKEEVKNRVEIDNEIKEINEMPFSTKGLLRSYIKNIFKIKDVGVDFIKSYDVILDISEGDSFSDIYGVKRFIQHSLVKLMAIDLNKKLVIMPQTLGPFKGRMVKRTARKILNKANCVFVRDDISKKVALEDLGVNRDVIYIPDMAFYMKPSSNISISKFISNNDVTKIGINVSALLYNGGYNGKNMFNLKADYKKLIDKLIETFAKMEKTEVILIPHVMTKEYEVEDDFRVCKKIASELSKKLNIKINTVDKYYREDEIKAIISGCDFFIGSRMHACIGAISTKVPTSPIAYSRKFIGIWEKIGLGYCVTDPTKDNEDIIIEKLLENFKNRDVIKRKLDIEIPLLKEKIESIVHIINN